VSLVASKLHARLENSCRPRTCLPGIATDRRAHLLVEREHPGVVGAADKVPCVRGVAVAVEIDVGQLGCPFRGEEDHPVDDAALDQRGLLTAADVGRMAVEVEVQGRPTALVEDPAHVGDRHHRLQALPSFSSEPLREDEPFIVSVGGAIGRCPDGNRRIHRMDRTIDDDSAILLNMSGPQDQVRVCAEVLVGSNIQAALAGARRIEDPDVVDRSPSVVTARLDHAQCGRRIYRRQQAILFQSVTDGGGWALRTGAAHEVKHGVGPYSAAATTMHTCSEYAHIARRTTWPTRPTA
jgi:hypothetical protein